MHQRQANACHRETQRAGLRRVGSMIALTCVTAAPACGGGPLPPPQTKPPQPAPVEPSRSLVQAEDPIPENVVHAEFQSSAPAIRPGGRFLLSLRFDIHPGYRISWTNPGDQGRATRVDFDAPPGFQVGPVRFPAPQRFELADGYVSYGYEEQTAAFVEVQAPTGLDTGQPHRFDVKADWLACQRECVSEELSAWFELVADPAAPEPRLPSDLRRHHRALPTAFSELPESSSDWKGDAQGPALRLSARRVTWLDFFPGRADQGKLLAVQPNDDALVMQFDRLTDTGSLQGLAVGEIDGQRAFFDVAVPVPH